MQGQYNKWREYMQNKNLTNKNYKHNFTITPLNE
jgi:hypothetical protein